MIKPQKFDIRLKIKDKKDWERYKATCEKKGLVWKVELEKYIREFR